MGDVKKEFHKVETQIEKIVNSHQDGALLNSLLRSQQELFMPKKVDLNRIRDIKIHLKLGAEPI